MTWKPVPIVDGSYADESRPYSVQDTINYIPEYAEQEGTRSSGKLRGAPGWGSPFCDLGTNAPIRGARNVEGAFFVVSSNKLFQINPNGSATLRGTIPGVGRVSMAHNQVIGGNQLAIANGAGGYVYDTSKQTLVQITDEAFIGAKCFDYVDSYIVGVEPSGRFAFTSGLADATSYSSFDRYESEGSPDKIVGQIVTHREWWLMGQRTIEPYQNQGSSTGTFQRSQGLVIERGLASRFAVAELDNSVFWLGDDGVVYRAGGYTPQRISTLPIEQEIGKRNTALAFAMVFEDQGHKIFYLTFPDGLTWGYDVVTRKWHRRMSRNLNRWRANTLTNWNGGWYAGDFSNGRIYKLDWNIQREDGEPLVRERVSGVLHGDQNRLGVIGVNPVFDTGQPENVQPISIIGSLGDQIIGLSPGFSYTASDGTEPYTFTLLSGSLPTGLTLNRDGSVTGISTTAGSYAWVVGAVDIRGTSTSKNDSSNVTADRAARFHNVPDCLTTPFTAPILGSGDFTVECVASYNVNGDNNALVSGRAVNIRGWALEIQENALNFRQAVGSITIDTTANLKGGSLVEKRLYHMAATRKGDIFKLWLDGQLVDTKTLAGSINEEAVTVLALGTSFFSIKEACLDGYMKWFALTVGVARYDANFTPPKSSASVMGATSAIDFNGTIGSTTFTDYTGRIWTNQGAVVIEVIS